MTATAPRNLPADDPAAVDAAARTLRAGGLVALPTETVYGVAAQLSGAGIAALLAAKGRDAAKGVTLCLADVAQMDEVAAPPDRARRLAARFWPGPLTLVVPEKADAGLPVELTGGGGLVGLRVPDHPAPRALARAVGPYPLTSANLAGEPEATTAAAVVAVLGSVVGLVLDGGPSPGGVPSTVVIVTDEVSPLRYGRIGALPAEAVEAALGLRRRRASGCGGR